MEITVKWESGESNQGFGAEFCSDENRRNRYIYGIASNGGYIIAHCENRGDYYYDVESQSDYINLGSSDNTLKIISKDNTIMFYVNNKFLKQLTFNGGYGQDFGVFANSGTKVSFSIFKLSGEKE